MASLAPPRRSHNSNSSCTPGSHRSHAALSPLQTLLQMGCPKTRAEKALAATGYRGAQLAADWLLAHVNDPTLDVNQPREYTLYLCPTGPLADQIQKYQLELLDGCGWNPSHNLVPHFTLCSFFQCPDDCVTLLVNAFDKCVEKFKAEFPETISLHVNMTDSMCAMLMSEEHKNVFKRFSLSFMKEISQFLGTESNPLHVIGTCFPWWSHFPSLNSNHPRRQMQFDPHGKSLHLTLAHLNGGRDRSVCQKLLSTIFDQSPSADCVWELRLYSRDYRLRGHEVHKVIYGHSPQQTDELEMLIGDFVYVNPDSLAATPDGWVQGVSWLTGNGGYLPTNYIERTCESDAWTVHRCTPIVALNPPPGTAAGTAGDLTAQSSNNGSDTDLMMAGNNLNDLSDHTHKRSRFAPPSCLTSSRDRSTSSDPLLADANINEGISDVKQSSSSSAHHHRQQQQQQPDPVPMEVSSTTTTTVGKISRNPTPKPAAELTARKRRIFILRHAERMDFTFGREWYQACFTDQGQYKRVDLNQPDAIPPRKTPQEWDKDAPLTKMGLFQAALTGQALASGGVKFSHVFCSPSYRCVQTCHEVMSQLGITATTSINIEPGLFEWLAWYADGLPHFLPITSLRPMGFNLSTGYTPVMSGEELNARGTESSNKFYSRSHLLVTSLLDRYPDGDLLFVGHSATLDALTCQLVGHEPRNEYSMVKIVRQIPYCGLVVAEQQQNQQQNQQMIKSDSNVINKKSSSGPGKWIIIQPPIPTLRHTGNQSFDSVKLLNTVFVQSMSTSQNNATNNANGMTNNLNGNTNNNPTPVTGTGLTGNPNGTNNNTNPLVSIKSDI